MQLMVFDSEPSFNVDKMYLMMTLVFWETWENLMSWNRSDWHITGGKQNSKVTALH